MNDGAEIATDSDDAGHAPGELIAGKYTLLHRLDPLAGTWLARCEAGTTAPRAIFALQLLRFPPSRVDAPAAFQIELQKVAALAHPNLLCPLDHGAHGDQELYVGYEWLKAKTLAQTLRAEWPLSDARVVSIMAQLLRALGAAHAAGMAHGDLKPSNLLLVPAANDPQTQDATQRVAGEHLLLRGLGLAEFSPYRCDETPPEQLAEIMAEWVVGDLDYAAPEQLTGELPSARSDLYAAGILLFQLLTRTVPFTALSAHELAFMHRFAPPEPPSAYALVNPTLEAICLRALSKTPDLRFQSASEMHAALVGALEPDPASSGGAALAFERARAQLARVSSVALAPAMRASSTALASLSSARGGGAALAFERARVHVARISSAALTPATRAESATLSPIFRPDAFSGAPVETAVGQRGQRGFTPLLALATLGVIAVTAWWLELSPPDSESAMDRAPTATAAQGLAGDASPATEAPWKPRFPPDIDPPANEVPSLAQRTATPALPLTLANPPAPEREPVAVAADITADSQRAHATLGQGETHAIDPQSRAEAPSPDPSRAPAAVSPLPHLEAASAPAAAAHGAASPEPPAVAVAPARGAHAQPLPAARRATTAVKPRAYLLAQSSLALAPPQPNADSAGGATRASRASASLAPALAMAAKAAAPAAPPPPQVHEPAAIQPEQHTPAASAKSAPRAMPPEAAKRATAYRVELGDPVTSRRSVSKGALRNALNTEALARCYRAAMAPAAEPSALHATLDITTDLSGRVRSAHLRGAKLEPELVQCVESHARRSRVREGDSSGAMQAAIALTFLAL